MIEDRIEIAESNSVLDKNGNNESYDSSNPGVLYDKTFKDSEVVGTNDTFERDFSFLIKKQDNTQYAVVASITGGLPDYSKKRKIRLAKGYYIGENDRRIVDHFALICLTALPTP